MGCYAMAFVKYSETERRRMAEIYVECGGNGRAIPTAVMRIRSELGICLPKDGRTLRNLKTEFGLEVKPKEAEVLFPGMFPTENQPAITRMMTFEEYQIALQTFAGADYVQDRLLLREINGELNSARIKEIIKSKTPEELLKLKQMIEGMQQQREQHLVRMTEFVDYRQPGKPDDLTQYDERILTDLEESQNERGRNQSQ